MNYLKHIIVSLTLISTCIPAMELPEAGTIIATPSRPQVLSLKQQAASTVCRTIHPENKAVSLARAKTIASKAKTLTNPDVKAYLLDRLKIENADAFQAMVTQEPKMLTGKSEFSGVVKFTQDRKKAWFLERDNWQTHRNRLVCLDIPSGTETVHDLNKTPYRIVSSFEEMENDHFVPHNEDNSQIALLCYKNRNPQLGEFLVIYNTQTKTFNEITLLPSRNFALCAFNKNKIVANAVNLQMGMPAIGIPHQEERTLVIDCETKQVTTIPHPLLQVSKSGRYITVQCDAQKLRLYTVDGIAREEFTHVRNLPALNQAETQIATIVGNTVDIYAINSGRLLHRIEYPFHVVQVLFKDDHTIIARAGVTRDNLHYETNLQTKQTKELVKSGYNIYINHGGTLNLTGHRGPITLATTENKKPIKTYNHADESWVFEGGFANNDEHILLKEDSMISSFLSSSVKRYPTFKQVTNPQSLEQLLDLCVQARQNKERSWKDYFYDLVFVHTGG